MTWASAGEGPPGRHGSGYKGPAGFPVIQARNPL